jgi:hypothetical protein
MHTVVAKRRIRGIFECAVVFTAQIARTEQKSWAKREECNGNLHEACLFVSPLLFPSFDSHHV